MHSRRRALLFFIGLFSLSVTTFLFAAENFTGEINANNINIRSDSTPSAEVICTVNKGRRLEVVLEHYDWYKVRLPKNAPAFVKKNLVLVSGSSSSAKVLKENVNIRLHPNESARILGRVTVDDILAIRDDKGEWLRVEAPLNTFGWINKKFVNKVSGNLPEPAKVVADEVKAETVTLEGVIKPCGIFFRRPTTHRLEVDQDKIFLLKADKAMLDALNQRKVKVTGRLVISDSVKYPIIEVEKIEKLE